VIPDIDEIRRNMLQILYAKMKGVPENPWVKRETMYGILRVDENFVVENVAYLEGEELLEVDGDPWETVKLSQKGLIILDTRMTSYCPHL
jgi:hypothetical protein